MGNCRSLVWAAVLCTALTACDSTAPEPGVIVSPVAVTLEDGATFRMVALLRNAKTRSVRWSSSNEAVARVDAFGVITAVTNGTATVTAAMTDDLTRTASTVVTVQGPPVATVAVNPPAATIYMGGATRLVVQLRAADGRVLRGRPVSFSNPDPSVADVTGSGFVIARGPGGPITIVVASEGRTTSSQIRVAHSAYFCPFIELIAAGGTATGTLAAGDCELPLDGSYVDVYRFTLATPAIIRADLTSTEFNAFLGLFNINGSILGEDDDSGGGQNARIEVSLGAGSYLLWVNSYSGEERGSYLLSLATR